jgi:hypothetical protein
MADRYKVYSFIIDIAEVETFLKTKLEENEKCNIAALDTVVIPHSGVAGKAGVLLTLVLDDRTILADKVLRGGYNG